MKSSADEFRQCLLRHRRPEVYHWTPACRLPSVLVHGLLCRRELDSRGIAYDPHSYGALGKEQDFSGHVCVSFYPQKGMMRTETGAPAILVMKSDIVAAEGTFYCPNNTARSEYVFDEISRRTAVEDLDDLFQGPTEWALRDWQAEVWIPVAVPASNISRVLFRNSQELNAALTACLPVAHQLTHTITFSVDIRHFPTPQPAATTEATS